MFPVAPVTRIRSEFIGDMIWRNMAWRFAYWVLMGAFLLTASLNLLHARAGFWTSCLADLTVPALLYILARNLVPGKQLYPQPLTRILGRTPETAAAALFLASTATEISQVLWPRGFFAGRFDPWDIVAYGVGLAVCYGFDRLQLSRRATTSLRGQLGHRP